MLLQSHQALWRGTTRTAYAAGLDTDDFVAHSASMTTWGVQLSTLESRASEHEQFASALVSNLADPLKHLAARSEELRKYHADYATKLEKERDSQYGDLRKLKGKYDSVCQEVENRRKKIDGSFDHGKQKARNAFEQQQGEMRNVKVHTLQLHLLGFADSFRTPISLVSTLRISKKKCTITNMCRSSLM